MGREMGPGLAVPAGGCGHRDGAALGDELGSVLQKGGNHASGPCFPFVCVPGTSLGKRMSYQQAAPFPTAVLFGFSPAWRP